MEPIDTPNEGQEAPAEGQPQLSEREVIEQEAIARYKESQLTEEERGQGTPEGYNDDGTPQEELIGGKFKSQDDLLTAYEELQKKLGQGGKDETPPEEGKKDEGEPPAPPTDFDTSKFEAEFTQNGSLSEESYAELATKGFSKADVDQYIQGQQYYAQSIQGEIHGSVGGKDNYTEIIHWASDNLEPETIKEYNDAVAAMDVAKIKRNLEYMQMKKEGSAPTNPRRIEGEGGGQGLQPFTDKNQWQRAQTDRLYGKDAKYTNMVDQRYLAARRKGLI